MVTGAHVFCVASLRLCATHLDERGHKTAFNNHKSTSDDEHRDGEYKTKRQNHENILFYYSENPPRILSIDSAETIQTH